MYVCNLYLTEYEMLLTISNCACTCIDPRWVRSRSPTMLSTPLVVRLLGERERSCNRAGILYSVSQDTIMFYVLLFNRHLSTFHKPCSFFVYVPLHERESDSYTTAHSLPSSIGDDRWQGCLSTTWSTGSSA